MDAGVLTNWSQLVVRYVKSKTLLACTAAALILIYGCKPYFARHKYPPGPPPIPFIGHGYVMFVKNIGRYRYDKWRKKYGNVVSYYMPAFGGWRIDLFGYDAIHEAFVLNAKSFSNRPLSSLSAPLKPGMMFAPDESWVDLRRHAISVLRDHGMGKTKMEDMISEEIVFLLEAVNGVCGQVISSREFQKRIVAAVSNITSQLVFGRRIDYDDPMSSCLQTFPAHFLIQGRAKSLPFLKYLPVDILGYHASSANFNKALQFFRDEISRHRREMNVSHPDGYIESYLVEGTKNSNPKFKDEDELVACITQLYTAGSDTTAVALTWSALFMVNNSEIQSKVRKEISDVIGTRCVKLSDRENMPYTQAVTHEVLRMASVATTSLPHLCIEDTVVAGHLIPKGCTVMANIWSTTHDESVYPEPFSFKPERFLNDKGEFTPPTGNSMLPFSIGKRMCPGDSFAKSMFFMFFVSIIQRFSLRRLTEELVSEESKAVFTNNCSPFELIINHC